MRNAPVTIQALPAQTLTASGHGSALSVGFYRELLLLLDITAHAGTTPTLNVYVDVSNDGGTTWFSQAYQIGASNINADGTQAPLTLSAAAGKAFGDTIRISYAIGGSAGPSFTASVVAIAK